MCRRRFFKSYLYIEYGGIKYKNGETVSVSPFIAEGNSTTIVLDSARPWEITNNISWLTVSSSSNKSGTYTITLTAAANQSYDGRSGSFTAKTLDDRYSVIVSVSQEPMATEKYIRITPSPISIGAEDTYTALECYLHYNGTTTKITPATWTSNNQAVTVGTNGVVQSNNRVASPLTATTTATYVHEGDTLTTTSEVRVAAAEIQRFITVEPQSVSMAATGTQQLTVTYHEIINGHETTTDVTNPSNYSSNSQVITVNGTGLISANNQSEDPATATITVTYDSVPSVNVPVTANSANVEYRNLRVEPSEMTLGSGDVESGKPVHAYVDEYINGQPTGVVVEVTSAATWNSNHTDVATVSQTGNNETIKPVYGSGYFPDERNATITGSYLGMTDTCEVTVEPEGYVEKYITVTPSTTSITSTGAVQLVVKLITKTDGVITGEETITNSATYAESSPLINVNSTGYVTATGSETGGTAVVTISYPGVDSITATINVQGASVDEYLEITPASTSTTWDGQVTYQVFYVREVNGQKSSTAITNANQLLFDLGNGTVGEMNGFVFEAENISTSYADEEISVTCTAGTYSGFSTRTPAELRVNGASSIVYRLDVTADNNNIAYNGTTQMRATYVTVVNGSDYDSQTIAPSNVAWSENSSYASITSAGELTANNNSAATRTVTVTGVYSGITGTTNVSIERKPALRVATSSEWHLTSGAGTCVYTVSWVNLKPSTTITFNDDNLDSYSPTTITITSSNYASGSQTITGTYSANNSSDSRRLYLYATGTGQYNEVLTSNDYYEQSGYNPVVTYELEVIPNSATLEYGDTTALTVMYYVVTDGQRDAGTNVSTAATYTNTGSNSTAITINSQKVIAGANTGNTDKDVVITISYGEAEPVNVTITSKKKQAVVTHALVVTPDVSSKPYSGSQQFVATYITLVDDVRDTSQDVDVTNSATWTTAHTGGTFTVLDVDDGLVEWVNLSTGGTAPTVRVSASYNGYTDHDDFTVANLSSLAATLTITPATTSVTYGDAVVYTLTLTIKHNGTTVYTKTLDGISAADNRFTFTADTELYYKNNETQFLNQNTGNTTVTANLTATFQESTPLYLPSGRVVQGTATADLINEITPVLTGWIKWDRRASTIPSNGVFEDAAALDWSNLDTSYPIVIECAYLDPNPTNLTNTASTGGFDKSDMGEKIKISGNTGSSRSLVISASSYDLSGNKVWDVLTGVTQNGGYNPPKRVWIKSGENFVVFYNESNSALTVNGFNVQIDSSYDLTCGSKAIAANASDSITGSLTGRTGTTSFKFTVDWRGDSHYKNTTTFSWRENGVQKTYSYDAYTISTDTYYITGDTELSDFRVTMEAVPYTYLHFDEDPSCNIKCDYIQDAGTYGIDTVRIIFAHEDDTYRYQWHISNSISPNRDYLITSPEAEPESDVETTELGGLALYIDELEINMNDTITTGFNHITLTVPTYTNNGTSTKQITFDIDHYDSRIVWYGHEMVVGLDENQSYTYQPNIIVRFH